jgi:sporulation protein YlmC with PRC-barrel domain
MEATMLKRFVLMSAVSAFAIAGALAQTPSPPSSTAPSAAPSASSDMKSDMKTGEGKFVASQKPDQWLASKFKGTDVLGSDDQKIGDVSDILFDKTGKIEAYVVSVGGFLGMGAKDVALDPAAFQVVPGDPNSATNSSPKLKTSMSKDELKNAANFEPYKEPRATTGTAPGGGTTRPMGGGGAMK